MEDLTARKRVFKGKVTRVENAVNSLTKDNVSAIAVYVDKVQGLINDCAELWNVSAKVCSEEQFVTMDEELALLDSKLTAIRITLKELSVNVVSLPSSSGSVVSEMKLPKIPLPTFSGDLKDWLSYRDLYIASVHQSATLTNAQKFQYLKLSLSGEVAQLLQNIPITDSNYTEAWEVLNQRYQNKRELVNSTLKRLFKQQPIANESPSALRRLLDNTNECVRSLKVLGEPVEHWDTILVYQTTEKLDSESRRQWELSLENNETPTFQQLLNFVEQRVRALIASNSTDRFNTKSETNSPTVKHQGKRVTTVCHSTGECKCEKCGQAHLLYKCADFINLPVRERHAFVKNNSLCFNCLRSSCKLSTCKSGRCRLCQGKHHSLAFC